MVTWALAMGSGALLGGCLVAVIVLRRKLVVVTVRGRSMEPTYHDNDRVVVIRRSVVSAGDVVVVERFRSGIGRPSPPSERPTDPGAVSARHWLIKRVLAAPGDPVPRDEVPALAEMPESVVPDGKLVLLGDNQEVSTDSRSFGYFPSERVLGCVLRPRNHAEVTTSSSQRNAG